ncbi:hypothetical protein ACWO4B_003210 [Clostridium sporogenes]
MHQKTTDLIFLDFSLSGEYNNKYRKILFGISYEIKIRRLRLKLFFYKKKYKKEKYVEEKQYEAIGRNILRKLYLIEEELEEVNKYEIIKDYDNLKLKIDNLSNKINLIEEIGYLNQQIKEKINCLNQKINRLKNGIEYRGIESRVDIVNMSDMFEIEYLEMVYEHFSDNNFYAIKQKLQCIWNKLKLDEIDLEDDIIHTYHSNIFKDQLEYFKSCLKYCDKDINKALNSFRLFINFQCKHKNKNPFSYIERILIKILITNIIENIEKKERIIIL